jgi:hypothetical protein
MESQALQELVRQIFSDEGTRTQFKINPDNVLTRFSLTEVEKKAVLTTHAKLGLLTSGSVQLQATTDPNDWWD